MAASREAYAFSEHGQPYLLSNEERDVAGQVVFCKDAVNSAAGIPAEGTPAFGNTGDPKNIGVCGLVIGLYPGNNVSDTIPSASRSSINQALENNDFMSQAGRSHGKTFRVIKKWDKTGRQYAVVDIDGALLPYQIPVKGVVFYFADFRDDTITSHSGRINGWKKIHKAKHDSAIAAWAGASTGPNRAKTSKPIQPLTHGMSHVIFEALSRVGPSVPIDIASVRLILNQLSSSDVGEPHPMLDSLLWEDEEGTKLVDTLSLDDKEQVMAEVETNFPSLFVEGEEAQTPLTLEEVLFVIKGLQLADITLEWRHVQAFFAIFVRELRVTALDEDSDIILTNIAKETLKVTEMAMGVSIPLQVIPSPYSSIAVNILQEFAKRVSDVAIAMDQQAEILAASLKTSGTNMSSSSMSMDETWKRAIRGKDSETVETAKADIGSVLLVLLKSKIQDPAVAKLNEHVQWAQRRIQELAVSIQELIQPSNDMDVD